MQNYGLYIFDFDGTLVDSFDSLYKVFDAGFSEIGTKINQNDVVYFSRVSFKQSFKKAGAKYNKQNLIKFANKVTFLLNQEDSINGTTIYPDVLETLQKLKEQGSKIAICTSNRVDHVKKVLEYVGLDIKLFDVIIGSEDCKRFKPYPDPILKTLEKLNFSNKKDVIYIGDALNDVKAAKKAKINGVLLERYSEYKNYKKIKINSLYELL